MSRRALHSNLLDNQVYFRQPLFIVDLNLTPVNSKSGGKDSSGNKSGGNKADPIYYTLKNQVDVRRQFITALHLATDKSYEMLRTLFLTRKLSQYDNSNINYGYLDQESDIYQVDFLMIDSYDIAADAASLYAKHGSKPIMYKTYESMTPLVKLWYGFFGMATTDLQDEVKHLEAAGFTIKSDETPNNGNPLGIRYLLLE